MNFHISSANRQMSFQMNHSKVIKLVIAGEKKEQFS